MPVKQCKSAGQDTITDMMGKQSMEENPQPHHQDKESLQAGWPESTSHQTGH